MLHDDRMIDHCGATTSQITSLTTNTFTQIVIRPLVWALSAAVTSLRSELHLARFPVVNV